MLISQAVYELWGKLHTLELLCDLTLCPGPALCSLGSAAGDSEQRIQGGPCHILSSVPSFQHLLLVLLGCSQLPWRPAAS